MNSSPPLDFSTTCLRLRPDASVEQLAIDDTFWQRLMTGQLGDFRNEFLVTAASHTGPWAAWEMHPGGDEIVCLLSGAATFTLELAGGTQKIELNEAGSYVVVPRGTWHTATSAAPCRLLFITPGEGTEHRPVT